MRFVTQQGKIVRILVFIIVVLVFEEVVIFQVVSFSLCSQHSLWCLWEQVYMILFLRFFLFKCRDKLTFIMNLGQGLRSLGTKHLICLIDLLYWRSWGWLSVLRRCAAVILEIEKIFILNLGDTEHLPHHCQRGLLQRCLISAHYVTDFTCSSIPYHVS